jgi:hypothetical protein
MRTKIKYKNLGRALKHMQQLNRKPGYDLKRAYKCPCCGKWHLTSQELRS